ncbi:archaetidylserine decarboxylase [Nevskia sp.]|uniref:archaetidylserine decarboxylase n=1 Tax=Nevskia sp. TaxID=1929292 RepID=UPI0025EC6E60|nr:archaetidylserine decarboxylase [Nevskia sp.]
MTTTTTRSAATTSDASLGDQLFAAVQRCLPTRALSALMYRIAEIDSPAFKNPFIKAFMRGYPIDLAEAERETVEQYRHFNDFFTRALKHGARQQPKEPGVLSSPVDGRISQLGPIEDGRIFQAKGHDYTAAELLADDALAKAFDGGSFATIYLAPHNYHRVHLPFGGKLRSWTYVPGRLFSVNPATARAMPRLFSRNERMVAVFDTAFGPMAVVMVGALFVGGIETVWGGRLTPPHDRGTAPHHHHPDQTVALARGDEVGRFHMGSTVVLLAPKGALDWDSQLVAGQALRLGQPLARVLQRVTA